MGTCAAVFADFNMRLMALSTMVAAPVVGCGGRSVSVASRITSCRWSMRGVSAHVNVCTVTGVASKMMHSVCHIEMGHYVMPVSSDCGVAAVDVVMCAARSCSIMVGEVAQEHAHCDEAPAKYCAHQIKLTEQI